MSTLKEYTIQELRDEINRRLAMDAKKVYERRIHITNFIKEYEQIFIDLANIMENDKLKETIEKIGKDEIKCIDLQVMIEDGTSFMDAIFKDGTAVWEKYKL